VTAPVIYWFRQDLRLSDLPGLRAAIGTGRPVIPVFILDDNAAGDWSAGGASRWWLHHSLKALCADIQGHGGRLILRRGDAVKVLTEMVACTGATQVFCTRHYEPWAQTQEREVHEGLREAAQLKRFPGHLLFEPEIIANKQGLPFKVFTPFWRYCRTQLEQPQPSGRCPKAVWHAPELGCDALQDWGLLPVRPNWAAGWEQLWRPGESGALDKLRAFLNETISGYATDRDFPAIRGTSRLSPHLHFGEISPARILVQTQNLVAQTHALQEQGDKFLSELGWREFSSHFFHSVCCGPELFL